MNHRRESRPDFLRRRPGWWQPLLILLAAVSCGLLIGMTTRSPPTCEAGGPCGAEAYFQETIYWEDENSVCGNGWCDPNEGVWNCPADCSECGDTVCRPEEIDTCPEDCPVTVTCGDGKCSHYENAEACPVDCEGITPTPEPLPTSTPRPTSSGGSGSGGQRATSTPRPTGEPTDTPSAEPEEAGEEPSGTEAGEPVTEADSICEVVDLSDLPGELVDTFNEYYDSGAPHLFATCESVPKEICVALEPDAEIPETVLDVPGRVLLRRVTRSDISIDDLGMVDLTTCISGGDCISYAPTSFDQASSLICFSVGDQELVPVCTNGCTFGLYKRSRQPEEAGPSPTPESSGQMNVSPLLIVILLGILILAVIALIIFLVLANRPSRS